MDLEALKSRKLELEASSAQLSNQWHIIQGHLAEVIHMMVMAESECPAPECPLAPQEDLPVE